MKHPANCSDRLDGDSKSGTWGKALEQLDWWDNGSLGGPSVKNQNVPDLLFTFPEGDLHKSSKHRWQQCEGEDDFVSEYISTHSPSKNRRERRKKKGNDGARGVQKHRRLSERDVATHENAAESNQGSLNGFSTPPSEFMTALDEQQGFEDLEGRRTGDEDDLEAYIEEYQAERAAFIRIGTHLYVVQGWSATKKEATEKWFHLEACRNGEEVRMACTCPNGTLLNQCVHTQTYLEFREEHYKEQEEMIFQAENFMDMVYGRESVVDDQGIGDPDNAEDFMLVDGRSNVQHKEVAVSFLPVLPPEWAQLDTDIKHYVRPSATANIPDSIEMDGPAQSMCGLRFTDSKPLGERIIKTFKVYTLVEELTREIEVTPCPNCQHVKHCFIGPETRTIGLFNYNNSVLFTHELLDEYTSRFTSSETPFVSFVETIERVYRARGSKFVKEDLFRSVWFAYASIQDVTRNMTCPQCAEEPNCVIFDGVTLAFGKKHLQDSLQPPTFTGPAAIERQRVYPVKPQLVQEGSKVSIQRLMKRWIQGKDRGGKEDDEEGDEDNTREEGFDVLAKRLQEIALDVAVLFERVLGPKAKIQPTLKQRYGVLLEQIAADKYATQMISVKSLAALGGFLCKPDWENATRLVDIPALYNVLEAELKFNQKYPEDLIQSVNKEEDWKLTGCYYSLPKIRDRPLYPRLRGDGNPEESMKDAKKSGCCKLYNKYGQKRLTGGIMCAWCTHTICYGFHCIPKAEGRNDVFATLLTRWKKAPDRVVYDFACALASYCMVREPEFFKNTQFLIDQFHEAGHSKCGSACFLSSYMGVDGDLGAVNSSAAQCRNSGLGRIRKSVSYMRQNRVILYTKVFFSIWNRRQIKRMAAKRK
ncbi:hypothetical protein AAF712_010415 [Marasmius tenuissimus]|uniref:SWIM-type domain-containing protein n=1 Tax=Marasmius tenuissimus TaxID=585030 RepID=A0ABR2ZN89_9AGAR